MVIRKIIWTKKAKEDYKSTLEFYKKRNGNNNYSTIIHEEITNIINKLKTFIYLGRPTKTKGVRILIKNHFKVFYEIKSDEVLILVVWDTRRNPDELIEFYTN